MTETQRITVAYGDGIGPEITEAVLQILDAARVPLAYDLITVGEQVYKQGITSGIRDEDWATIRKNRVMLKGPITTPQGGGYQERQRDPAQDPGTVRQRAPVQGLYALRGLGSPRHGPGHHPRERGGPVRRHRAPADPRSRPRCSS